MSFMIGKVVTTAWQLYIARFFTNSPDDYGMLMLFITQAVVWTTLADCSISQVNQQLLSRVNIANKIICCHLTVVLVLRIILGVLAAVGYFIFMIFQFSDFYLPLLLVSMNIFLMSTATSSLGILAARQDFRIEAVSSLISSFLFVITAFLVTKLTNNISSIIACYLIGTFGSLTYVKLNTSRRWSYVIISKRKFSIISKKYLYVGFPLTLSAFIFLMYFRGDLIVATSKVSAKSAGIYSITLLLFFLIADLFWSQFGKAYAPRLLNLWQENIKTDRRLENELRAIFDSFAFLAVILLVGVAVFARHVFSIIFGSDSPWVESSNSLFWLMMGFFPTIGYSLVSRLISFERKNTGAIILGGIILFFKFTIMYLIPKIDLFILSFISVIGLYVLFLSVILMLGNRMTEFFFNVNCLIKYFIPPVVIFYSVYLWSLQSLSTLFASMIIIAMIFFSGYLNRIGVKFLIEVIRAKQ